MRPVSPPDYLAPWHDWRAAAACAGQAELFFPAVGDRAAAARARGICHDCTVRSECVDFAGGLELDLAGIWGATSPKQRAEQRRHAS